MEEGYTASWEAQYASGRYLDEPPVAFVDDIVRASRATSRTRGLYIGCGNGRNFMPLLEAGMDLVGLDISPYSLAATPNTSRGASRFACVRRGSLARLVRPV